MEESQESMSGYPYAASDQLTPADMEDHRLAAPQWRKKAERKQREDSNLEVYRQDHIKSHGE
eukprot:CAMPEP_0184295492 /NCGR_PEP_ID=MMETSP1049-20130417/6323_1 /TAXON_ID=77928 /ORGANISM="Proteomonas sulcata, Strain CCMP704" /LENGTH=61 /DNA_ID=CAMNT_0026604021 /DNA_START=72 /DNA_END=254 /DNA_ORIENTATION=+